MKILRIVAVLVSFFSMSFAHADDRFSSIWAKKSHDLTAAGLDMQGVATVPSPDKHFTLRLHAAKFELLDSGRSIKDLSEIIGSVNLTEVSWSSDSKAFFVNASDGGEVGTWATHVFVISKGVVNEINVSSIVMKNSNLATDCEYKNIGSLGWVSGHSKLILLEQVPNSSRCSNMNEVSGYVFDVDDDKIIEVLDKNKIASRYKSYLGDMSMFLVTGK